jgi:6-phosphogluconolactonase (cycloisomerase 2 family)
MKTNKLTTLIILIFGVSFLSCGSGDDNGDLTTEFGAVFVSSNTTPVVGIYDFSSSSVSSVQFGLSSTDSDGIIYSSDSDELYIASRSNNRVEVYTNLKETEASLNLNLAFSSSQDFVNARKMASSGNKLVVSQDASDGNNQTNAFYVYEVGGNAATLSNTYTTDIHLWDIQFSGNSLYAIQDNSDTLAVYNNFLSNSDGLVSPSIKVQIEGIVRTHALYYSASTDIMFLSDIGDAASDSDGAIHVINNFSSKFSAAGNNGTISLSDQIVIEGSSTELGNPVGLAYDNEAQKIYVAERAVDGGKLLEFDLPSTNGNASPTFSQNFAGSAAVYLAN